MMLCDVSKRKAGFTLVEIMIVIAIIAILAAIAIPNVSEARAESQLQACMQNVHTIASALEMALARRGNKEIDQMTTWDNVEFLIEEGYLKGRLHCPLRKIMTTDRNAYRIFNLGDTGYDYYDHSMGWIVTCMGKHRVGEKTMVPVYGQRDGFLFVSDTSAWMRGEEYEIYR